MPYTPISRTPIAVGKAIRQSDVETMLDNEDYLNDQLATLSPDISVFTHFADRHGYSSDTIVAGTGSVAGSFQDALFHYFTDTATGDKIEDPLQNATSFNHYIRITGTAGFQSNKGFRPDAVSLPITFRVNMRGSAIGSGTAIYMGLMDFKNAVAFTPTRGVWVERSSGTQWRLAADDNASPQTGTPFTDPANDTWTEFKIVYTSSTDVELFVNGVSQDSFTADLPDDGVLHGIFYVEDMGNVDVDLFAYQCASGLTDLT